ncbi:MAG: AzlC family ABC transporter permease [Roseburia sp.]
MKTDFKNGVRDGLPIAMGYFGVSFTFGIMAAKAGLSPWMAGLISLTNLTSAGQFAGLTMIVAQASMAEVVLTQFVINLRYALMSLSLSQKLEKGTGTGKRMLMAFANTDEVFAMASARTQPVTFSYMAGLESVPIASWTVGTVVGAVATGLLPQSVSAALGLALYAMFVAIVLPPARKDHHIAAVALVAMGISCLLYYAPVLKNISSGFAIIISTVLAAGLGAFFFPIEDGEADGGDTCRQEKEAGE